MAPIMFLLFGMQISTKRDSRTLELGVSYSVKTLYVNFSSMYRPTPPPVLPGRPPTGSTADRLAQLVECRTTVREVVGSNPGRTYTQGL